MKIHFIWFREVLLILFMSTLLTGVSMTDCPTFADESANQEENEAAKELRAFMADYQENLRRMYCEVSYAWWDAMITGDEKAFEKSSQATLEISTYHSSPDRFHKIRELRQQAQGLSSLEKRAAYLADRSFEESQLPPDLMEKMIRLGSEIEQIFQTQRGILDGKKYTNNELLEMLAKENDSQRRFEIWDALKQVGELVAPKIIELAKIRNEAAAKLGYKNYWEMSVRFQEYQPEELMAIFDELEELTTPIFREVKADLDNELKQRFGVDQIMPWHYDNPFFQQAPPSREVNPDEFFAGKSKEDIVEMSIRYYDSLGLDVRPIINNSDLFEKPGKSQHGFCNNMNKEGDVRILCNIKPTAEWMDTQLHELGHAAYDYYLDPNLPFNVREVSHIFTTEGVAMMFGAKARDPQWLVDFAGAPEKRAKEVAGALKKQRLREQLIFCRWTLVMLHFEKSLYENPDQDLNQLWTETVAKYQLMPWPKNRRLADWASKPHFVIAPVYYHNYMLGELFGAQLRKSLEKEAQGDLKKFGQLLRERVFLPGNTLPWKDFVKQATGEPFSAKAFAEELR